MPNYFDQLRALEIENANLKGTLSQTPTTPQARGEQVKQAVDHICSELNAAGCWFIYRYRVEMCGALIDVLFGGAAVDVPSWPVDTTGGDR